MNKPEYIKKIEGEGVLSVLHVGKYKVPENIFDNKNSYNIVYIDSELRDLKFMFSEKVIKTKHGFYIHLHKLGVHNESVDIKVYYAPEQTNELIIYIKQLLKQF